MWKFYINMIFLAGALFVFPQAEDGSSGFPAGEKLNRAIKRDSLADKERSAPAQERKTGKRLFFIQPGYDIGKKIFSLTQKGNIDEINLTAGYKKYRLEVIYGLENRPLDFKKYTLDESGSYLKVGLGYNFYENWPGTDNEITLGFRYGQSRYNYTVKKALIYPPDPREDPMWWDINRSYANLTARWVEVVSAVKTEIFKHFYLELRIAGKYMIRQSNPENFESVYVPGFFKTNISGFGFGMGYGISYKFKF